MLCIFNRLMVLRSDEVCDCCDGGQEELALHHRNASVGAASTLRVKLITALELP